MGAGHLLELAGGVLQVAGVVTVAVEVRNMRRAIGAPSSLDRITQALTRLYGRAARLWRRPSRHVVVGAATIQGTTSITADGFVTMGPLDGVPVDEAINRLRNAVNQQARQIDALNQRISDEGKQRAEVDARERLEREELGSYLKGRIDSVVVGRLGLAAVGVACFVIGLILSTVGALVS